MYLKKMFEAIACFVECTDFFKWKIHINYRRRACMLVRVEKTEGNSMGNYLSQVEGCWKC